MKAPNLEGVRLLIVQPLTRELAPVGQPVVAADALDTAGPGELVYIVGAREAAEAMPNRFVPVDHAIVGIVDAVENRSRGGGHEAGAGRVRRVVSTIKSPIFEDRALLLCDLLEPDGRPSGGYLIALDTVGAGAGETVLILDEGTSAPARSSARRTGRCGR